MVNIITPTLLVSAKSLNISPASSSSLENKSSGACLVTNTSTGWCRCWPQCWSRCWPRCSSANMSSFDDVDTVSNGGGSSENIAPEGRTINIYIILDKKQCGRYVRIRMNKFQVHA